MSATNIVRMGNVFKFSYHTGILSYRHFTFDLIHIDFKHLLKSYFILDWIHCVETKKKKKNTSAFKDNSVALGKALSQFELLWKLEKMSQCKCADLFVAFVYTVTHHENTLVNIIFMPLTKMWFEWNRIFQPSSSGKDHIDLLWKKLMMTHVYAYYQTSSGCSDYRSNRKSAEVIDRARDEVHAGLRARRPLYFFTVKPKVNIT